jgi:ribosomal protein S18 acetylase RimI-like enzyme
VTDELKPQIRASAAPDTDALNELLRRTIRASYSPFLGVEAVEAYIGSGAVETFTAETVERGSVVTLGDKIAGYGVETGNQVDLLVIDERFHRLGLGTAMLAHLERRLFENFDLLSLESFRDNDAANAFYLGKGWRKIREYREPDYGVEMVELQKDAP